jgi:hypothetical protein
VLIAATIDVSIGAKVRSVRPLLYGTACTPATLIVRLLVVDESGRKVIIPEFTVASSGIRTSIPLPVDVDVTLALVVPETVCPTESVRWM